MFHGRVSLNTAKRFATLLALCSVAATRPADATDGCKVLLCLAGNWSNISACRPDVDQAMREAAMGRGWPSCQMGDSSQTDAQWTSQQTCPVFYSSFSGDASSWTGCRYEGLIRVTVSGLPWSDVFWSTSGNGTSTKYYAPARNALGASIDPRYDNDAAAYATAIPLPLPCRGDGC